MDELKFEKLRADQIEVRIKQVTEWGASCVLYKTARTDMDMLDAAVTPYGWSCEYQEIKGCLYCGITINGVSKWDCGIESRDDGDGTKKKGEASDAFKRAGFKWGIGRELYTAPRISIDLPREADSGGRWKLAKGVGALSVFEVGYDAHGDIEKLVIIEERTKKKVFCHPRGYVEIEKLVVSKPSVPKPETDKQKALIFGVAKNRGITEVDMRMKAEGWYEMKHGEFKKFDTMTHEDIVEIKVNQTKVMEYAL